MPPFELSVLIARITVPIVWHDCMNFARQRVWHDCVFVARFVSDMIVWMSHVSHNCVPDVIMWMSHKYVSKMILWMSHDMIVWVSRNYVPDMIVWMSQKPKALLWFKAKGSAMIGLGFGLEGLVGKQDKRRCSATSESAEAANDENLLIHLVRVRCSGTMSVCCIRSIKNAWISDERGSISKQKGFWSDPASSAESESLVPMHSF